MLRNFDPNVVMASCRAVVYASKRRAVEFSGLKVKLPFSLGTLRFDWLNLCFEGTQLMNKTIDLAQ